MPALMCPIVPGTHTVMVYWHIVLYLTELVHTVVDTSGERALWVVVCAGTRNALLALYLGEECAVYQIDDAISNYSSTTGDHSLEAKKAKTSSRLTSSLLRRRSHHSPSKRRKLSRASLTPMIRRAVAYLGLCRAVAL